MDISIIVPVYNAEKYLKRCIDSIIKSIEFSRVQGEILLIDNNSKDDSKAVCEELRKKYSIVKVYECRKKGAGAARNFGAKLAEGKYIWFIDVDDEIEKEAVLKLLKTADKNKADLVMMGAMRVYQNQKNNYLSAVMPNEKNFKSRFVRYGIGPWQVLIRRAWWEKNNFSFREEIIHEDMELMSSLILYTDNFSAVDEPLYLYYQNIGSVLHKSGWDGHAFDIFPALEGLYKKFEDKKAEKQYHDELEWFFIWNLLIDSAKDFEKDLKGQVGFSRTRKMLRKYFPFWWKNRFLHQKSLKFRVRCFLNYWK
jgi:glycosyltransferase involved in cell wall biosynthesis